MEKEKIIINYNELKFEGEYLYGKRNGKGKEYNLTNQIEFEGEYLNGERYNGILKMYNLDGELDYEVAYFNGKKDGEGKEYYENDQLEFEGKYLNGKKMEKEKDIIKMEN